MMNAFPAGSEDTELRLRAIDDVTRGVPSDAVCEAARRFTGGMVDGQNARFAPSAAEFAQEARRLADLLKYRNRPALPKPKEDDWTPQPKEHRERMGFKMSMLSAGLARDGGAAMVAEAHRKGLPHLIELARAWNVPVPDGLEH